MYTTKTELKAWLKDELKCPQEFINRCTKFKQIDKLKEAVMDDDKEYRKEVMDDIRESYKDFCEVFGLDIQEDNRKVKIDG